MYYIGHNPAHSIQDRDHWIEADEEFHMAVAGKTGTGKSTFLSNYVYELSERGLGVLVGDPHGSLISDLKKRIRREDVFEFSITRLAPLNFLAAVEPRLAIDAAWRFIASTFNQANAPQSEDIFRFALWALYKACPINIELETYAAPHFGLLQRFLDDIGFRKKIWSSLPEGDEVRVFFESIYDGEWAENNGRMRTEKTAPILNKIHKFTTDPVLRQLFCVAQCVNLRKMIDEGKMILLDLAQSDWGEEASEFVGAVWHFLHYGALISRKDDLLAGKKLTPSFAVWDEFGTFMKSNVTPYLSGARKFKGFLILATQTFLTLDKPILHAVLGNVTSFLVFRVGGEEAELFTKEFGSDFPQPIQNLWNYYAFFRSVRNLVPIGPVHVQTFPPEFDVRTAA